jgi:hypothetical protein
MGRRAAMAGDITGRHRRVGAGMAIAPIIVTDGMVAGEADREIGKAGHRGPMTADVV